jgi:hypothetical protein
MNAKQTAVLAALAAVAVVLQPVTAGIGLAGLGLCLLILRSPRLGLLLSVFTLFIGTPSLRIQVGGDTVQYFIFQLLLVPTLFSLIARAAFRREPLTVRSPFLAVCFLVAGGETLALLWAPQYALGAGHILTVLCNVLFFYLLLRLTENTAHLRDLFAVVMAAAFCMSAWMGLAAFQHFDGSVALWPNADIFFELFSQERWSRIGGLCAASQAGGFLVFATMLAAGLSRLHPPGGKRRFYAVFALYCIFWVAVSASRGAMIAAVGGAGLFILFHPALKRRLVSRLTVLVVLTVSLTLLGNPSFIDRMLVGFGYSGPLLFTEKKAGSDTAENVSGTGARVRMWGQALKIMAEEPHKILLGLGPGGFIHHTGEPEVHSLWLSYYFDMGLLGSVIGLFAMFVFIRGVREGLARGPDGPARILFLAALAGVISEAFIHSLIDHDLTSPVSRFTWLYMAVLAASLKILHEEESLTGVSALPAASA